MHKLSKTIECPSGDTREAKAAARSAGSRRPLEIIAQWLHEAKQEHEGDTWLNRRRRKRFRWSSPLDIYAACHEHLKAPIPADACDLSEIGMGFRCRIKIPRETIVFICRRGTSEGVRARVTACTQTVGGYRIGVQFDFGSLSFRGALGT